MTIEYWWLTTSGPFKHIGKLQMTISQQCVIRSTSCLVLWWVFVEWQIERHYFRLDESQDGGQQPFWKFQMAISQQRVHRSPSCLVLWSGFRDGGSNCASFIIKTDLLIGCVVVLACMFSLIDIIIIFSAEPEYYWLLPASPNINTAEPFSHRPRSVLCLFAQMRPCHIRALWLRSSADNESHCRHVSVNCTPS